MDDENSTSAVQVAGTDGEDGDGDSRKTTFKAIIIFLLVVAILLCIALGIVIIWRYLNEIA